MSEWLPQQRDRVEHEKYGSGTVSTAYRDVRGNARVCVRFDKFRGNPRVLSTGTWAAADSLKPASDGSTESTENGEES